MSIDFVPLSDSYHKRELSLFEVLDESSISLCLTGYLIHSSYLAT